MGVNAGAAAQTSPRAPAEAQAASLDIAERCRTRLSPALQDVLREAARLADALAVRVYAVGGFVRDLLLGVPNEDLDLTVEGDGVGYARHLAVAIGGACKGPSEFGTAVVVARDGRKIDVATARAETYARPAALPTVRPGSIRDDLFRRDFTVNTLAFALNGPEAFRLLDWYGGLADLRAGVVRVLHNRSFRDDPTRIFRAVRLGQRLGFAIHPHTVRLLQRAVQRRWIDLLSGARLWRELRLILEEEAAVQCLMRLEEWGVLAQIDPALTLSAPRLDILRRLAAAQRELAAIDAAVSAQGWLAYLAALFQGLEAAVIRRVCGRLALAPRLTQQLIEGLGVIEAVCRLIETGADLRPSAVVAALRPLPLALLPVVLACCPEPRGRQYVRQYLASWRQVRPWLRGDDLQRLGVPQGPRIGQLLARLREARLDGETRTRQEEEALVQRLLRAASEPAPPRA
jgi:tRNA nucleotidyltransferase (CCA-adding enzyme)